MDQLPWVMLGIRATQKDDLGASPAEFVYGAPLALPGQSHNLAGAPPSTEPFLCDLRQAMEKLQPVPTSTHGNVTAEHIPAEFQKCPMVWIRRDGHRQPLTPQYNGPFQVVGRQEKFFRIKRGEKEDAVSIDRLKPATIPEDTVPATQKKRPGKDMATAETEMEGAQEATTRSGCQVRRPERLGIHSVGIHSVGGGGPVASHEPTAEFTTEEAAWPILFDRQSISRSLTDQLLVH